MYSGTGDIPGPSDLLPVYDRTPPKSSVKASQLRGVFTANLPPGYARPAGVLNNDPQFDLAIEFGKDNDLGTDGFSDVVEVTRDAVYYVRAKIAQHQVAPLILGVTLEWTLPAGWRWVDGLGNTTSDELPSNPGYVCRVAQAPHQPTNALIKAVVTERFL